VDNKCLTNFVNIANTCILLNYWPLHFKKFISIIISNLTKFSTIPLSHFDQLCFLTHLEKAISKRLQTQAISSLVIYLNQVGGLKHRSVADVEVYLTHFI